ncbi:hypothetical protein FB562_0267 [Homoserinimonas aerilata]|uniref:Spermatogenesis-associated protein 20-like TRX domain-containing protein n=1 Tax=Homoserinimonas aerilata TaxID=1162970 RepID=A0A542YGL4_9MICO|nr:DUF255 domain-containing protein [Homoserinimonas aerilata]TQL47215.1 hypothetical protein FB562_0267 [Homoserinimonas aerilata]
MPNRLADAVSPYLRGHADNPVDWWPWGADAFEEAARRDVPVLVSIGYATCHWCHVMARESFSDEALASYLNAHFVSVKVDREEHPDVDATYMAAAGAFTGGLGWPLNVFVTPKGRAFFAGTYSPPLPLRGHPSFRQVLEAVQDAWANRRGQLEASTDAVTEALAAAAAPQVGAAVVELRPAVERLLAQEDALYGGFGSAPKFPSAPVLNFLLASGDSDGVGLARRTLQRMSASPLRDAVEGGFFRYSTMRDWSEPHYERMLYDNALLLDACVGAGDEEVAAGVAGFLIDVMQLPSGGFASAQDSESDVDGSWSEGGYYRLDADARARLVPPRLDEKVLSGWNGLAIAALARAGFRFAREEWVSAGRRAADHLLDRHLVGGRLVRVSLGERMSDAVATLEDHGMLAGGLLQLALATGEPRYAEAGRGLIDATLGTGVGSRDERPGGRSLDPQSAVAGRGGAVYRASLETAPASNPAPVIPFAAPGGADPVLAAQGLALAVDPSEGAYPSGLSACALAAHTLFLLSGEQHYRVAAETVATLLGERAAEHPIAFGGTLELLARLAGDAVQLVVVSDAPAGELVAAARSIPASVTALVSQPQASAFAAAGFELFAGRASVDGQPTAYLCRDFVCRLPVMSADALLGASGV